MNISSRRENHGVFVLEITGKFTVEGGSSQAYEAVLSALRNGESKILLDMGGVSALDSAGVGELVSARTSAMNRGSVVKLLNLTPRVGEVLKITQLIGLFEIFEDDGEAIASFA